MNTVTGQNENNGTSIIDVTDRQSRDTSRISRPGGHDQRRRRADGPSATPGPAEGRSRCGLSAAYIGTSAHEIWDVGDPSAPKLVAGIGGKYRDTHKSWWECDTGIAYLVSGVDLWRAPRMTEVYDLSDPAKPV